MSEHTKLPVSIIYQGSDSFTIGVRDPQIIVAHVPIVRVKNGDCGAARDKAQAIADFIVQAYNSYTDLFGACKMCFTACYMSSADFLDEKQLAQLKAAIEKAEPVVACSQA